MSITRISVDTTVLPAALLASVKAHCRVEHARDDAILTSYTAAAIGMVERKCNVSLNPAEYLVSADELRRSSTPRAAAPSWWLPLNNVSEFTAAASADPAADDISAGFELWAPDFGGSASAYLVAIDGQAMPAAATLTLIVGVDDPADLAPPFFALIARLAASMYENREASTELMADGFADELMALWRPDA